MTEEDYINKLFADAMRAAGKAQRKFPQPNYVALKVAEEAGEVLRAAVHCAENRMETTEIYAESVQLIAMAIRLLIEGDKINGVPSAYHNAKRNVIK